MDRNFVPPLLKQSHSISRTMPTNQSSWNSGYVSTKWCTMKYFIKSKREKQQCRVILADPHDCWTWRPTNSQQPTILWILVEHPCGVGNWGVNHRTPCGHCRIHFCSTISTTKVSSNWTSKTILLHLASMPDSVLLWYVTALYPASRATHNRDNFADWEQVVSIRCYTVAYTFFTLLWAMHESTRIM